MAPKKNPKNPKLKNYPSQEFLDLKKFASRSFPKGHIVWLQKQKRLNQFYERAKEMGLEIHPVNYPQGYRCHDYQSLIVVVDHTPGALGSLKMLQFCEEFKYKGPDLNMYTRYRGDDERLYVV